MLNYEDLIGNILFNVYDKKTSGCNDDFLEMKGFKNLRITGYAEPYVDEKGNIRLIFHFSYKWENYSGGTNGTDLGLMIFEIRTGHVYLKQPFTYSN